jgi:hypothetical protein
VAISWNSARAVHRSASRNGGILSANPEMRSPANLTSDTMLSDPFSLRHGTRHPPKHLRHSTILWLQARQAAPAS